MQSLGRNGVGVIGSEKRRAIQPRAAGNGKTPETLFGWRGTLVSNVVDLVKRNEKTPKSRNPADEAGFRVVGKTLS